MGKLIRVATTKPTVEPDPVQTKDTWVVNAGGDLYNDEDDVIIEHDWRRVFVELPVFDPDREINIPRRSNFPSDLPWMVMDPEESLAPMLPSLIAIRGFVHSCDIDKETLEEEVSVGLDLFPHNRQLLTALKRGAAIDRLFLACLRAINLFPRHRVEVGSSFTAYLGMGFRRAGHTASAPTQLGKIVWDLQIQNAPSRTDWSLSSLLSQLKRPSSAWTRSTADAELLSTIEACLVMDLHSVLLDLWCLMFRKEHLLKQLHEKATTFNREQLTRMTFGKSQFRRWSGGQLFSS